MQRDLDVIAIPWTPKAASRKRLVKRLCQTLECTIAGKPTVQPHGRKSWALMMRGAGYMDLSVMPRDSGR